MNFLKNYKNIIPLVIIGLVVWFFVPFPEFVIQMLVFSAITEFVAILLSILAVYSYTEIDFMQEYMAGTDKDGNPDPKLSAYEQSASNSNLGYIFLGVHLLVGLCAFVTLLALAK